MSSGHHLHAIADQHAGIAGRQFVLRGTGQRNIAGHIPDRALSGGDECRILAGLHIVADPRAAHFLDLSNQVKADAVFIHHISAAVRAGDDLCAEFHGLFHRMDRHIA